MSDAVAVSVMLPAVVTELEEIASETVGAVVSEVDPLENETETAAEVALTFAAVFTRAVYEVVVLGETEAV